MPPAWPIGFLLVFVVEEGGELGKLPLNCTPLLVQEEGALLHRDELSAETECVWHLCRFEHGEDLCGMRGKELVHVSHDESPATACIVVDVRRRHGENVHASHALHPIL
jgi:hypothetical protein